MHHFSLDGAITSLSEEPLSMLVLYCRKHNKPYSSVANRSWWSMSAIVLRMEVSPKSWTPKISENAPPEGPLPEVGLGL